MMSGDVTPDPIAELRAAMSYLDLVQGTMHPGAIEMCHRHMQSAIDQIQQGRGASPRGLTVDRLVQKISESKQKSEALMWPRVTVVLADLKRWIDQQSQAEAAEAAEAEEGHRTAFEISGLL